MLLFLLAAVAVYELLVKSASDLDGVLFQSGAFSLSILASNAIPNICDVVLDSHEFVVQEG